MARADACSFSPERVTIAGIVFTVESMNTVKIALSAMLVAVAAVAYADNSPTPPSSAPALTPVEKSIKETVEKHMEADGAKVESIRKTDMLGMYELHVEMHGADSMFYTDEKAKYILSGHVFDLDTGKDLTSARLSELNKINFNELPFDSAIKMVKGNGKRVIAVFEDPNCGYCKRLRHELAGMDNVTVYTFMYNILAPDSSTKSKNVWCSQNRLKAWDDWMVGGKLPAAAPANCTATPNEQVLALGGKLHITGTPTIFYVDGSRTPGFLERAGLEEKWSSLQ